MLSELLIIAATLMAEAGGEPLIGKKAVASVIVNRASSSTPGDVCLAPMQFSCWNAGEHEMIVRIRTWVRADSDAWTDCLAVARHVTEGTFKPTIAANHYFNPEIASPSWATQLHNPIQIGSHLFGEL